MKSFLINILKKIKEIIYRYPIIVAAIVIYGYYLLTTLNLFENHTAKKSLLDYVLQFDSLIFMWLAAAAYVQILKIQKEHKAESSRRSEIEKQFETQKIHTKVVNEITALLQDNVNNPLAVISITSKEIRRKFEKDTDIIRWLDRIDSSMQRIHNTIRDIQLYETQKMIDESSQKLVEEK